MPQRWAIRFAIEGDLRFSSHHDLMRAIERTAARAALPVRYSQGYNPRPILSMPCPRPVAVATRDDLLVVELTDAAADLGAAELLRRLNEHAPRGLTALRAERLEGKGTPRPRRARYELLLPPNRSEAVRRRLSALAGAGPWQVERLVPGRRGRRPPRRRAIDLRPLVAELDVRGRTLRMTLQPQGDLWARPGEVLGLVGLDGRADLARAVRTGVDYEGDVQAEGDIGLQSPRQTHKTV